MSPLYLLPGWGLGRGPLQPLSAALQGNILDLPGYGDTPASTDFWQAVDVLATRLPGQADLCGWSLGSLFALAIASRHPGKVHRLALIASTPCFAQRPDWPEAMPTAQLAAFANAVAADVNTALPRFVSNFSRGDQALKKTVRELLALASPWPATDVLLTGLRWLAELDLRPLLGNITAPTLLLHGEHDPLMPCAAAQSLQAAMPDARLAVIPGTAHAPFISKPDACLPHLHAFLA